MRVEGWLLDVAFTGGDAFLWVRTPDRGRVKLLDRYHPDFFAEPRGVDAGRLRDLLEEHGHIAGITVERRISSIREMRETTVLRIRVDSAENYRKVLTQVEALACVGEIYDGDMSHALRYLSDRELIPLGRGEAETGGDGRVKSLRALETALEAAPPPLQVLPFEAELGGKEGSITTLDELLRSEYVFRGPARQALKDFLDYFADLDPDIVCCREDALTAVLCLSKLYRTRRFGSLREGKPFLYGGRAHIEPSAYSRLGLAGIVERAMFTRATAGESSGWAAGKAIDSRQCYEARRRRILVPRAEFLQPVTPLDELLVWDKGSLVLAPNVGLHEDVGVLDFESMFPNLIIGRNISYENVGLDLGRDGFITGFTRNALARRLHFKRLRRRLPRGSRAWMWCEARQLALKEMLVVIYGYSGCFANRFGNMDTYMEINRQARDGLVAAMNIARLRGFRSLYGNGDSLFLHRPGATRDDYEALAAEVSRRLGMPMAVENVFRFLVLLPQKGDPGLGAANRYYGRTEEGLHEHRGIELRRRDTPPYVARVQREAVEALLACESMEEVRTAGVERALRVIEDACRRLRRGEVPPYELRVSTVLRRSPGEYKARLPHVAAAEALGMAGARVEAGSLIDYVYVDAGHRNPFRRARPACYEGGADVEKYAELVREAGRSILMPFEAGPRGGGGGGRRPLRLSECGFEP